MPLSAVNFVAKGPVKSADLLQFVNLFTGAMNDQPVTFSNTLSVGGTQGAGVVPLTVYGAVGQTSNLINLFADRTQAQPGFGLNAAGTFSWGPGGSAPLDTTMGRIGTQQTGADMAGLLVNPNLVVPGTIFSHGAIRFQSGAAIADGGGGILDIATSLTVASNIYLGSSSQPYLHQVAASIMGIEPRLFINGPPASGLPYSTGHLQVRSDDMPDSAGSMPTLFTGMTWSGNWLQWSPKFYKATAGIGWPGVALLLDYDVDSSNAVGGRISMMNGKVGIGLGGLVSGTGDVLQVFGNETIRGNSTITGNLGAAGVIGAGPSLFAPQAGDISAGRGNGTGYVFLGSAAYYVGWNGSNMILQGAGNLDVLSMGMSVAGSIGVQGAGAGPYAVNVPNSPNTYGQGYANAWISASSISFKENIAPIDDALALVRSDALHGVRYTHDGLAQMGFVADYWAPKVPEVVSVGSDGQPVGIEYGRVGAITFEALKQYVALTDARLKKLEARG